MGGGEGSVGCGGPHREELKFAAYSAVYQVIIFYAANVFVQIIPIVL